jgi:hypothetical protein
MLTHPLPSFATRLIALRATAVHGPKTLQNPQGFSRFDRPKSAPIVHRKHAGTVPLPHRCPRPTRPVRFGQFGQAVPYILHRRATAVHQMGPMGPIYRQPLDSSISMPAWLAWRRGSPPLRRHCVRLRVRLAVRLRLVRLPSLTPVRLDLRLVRLSLSLTTISLGPTTPRALEKRASHDNAGAAVYQSRVALRALPARRSGGVGTRADGAR